MLSPRAGLGEGRDPQGRGYAEEKDNRSLGLSCLMDWIADRLVRVNDWGDLRVRANGKEYRNGRRPVSQ